MGDHSNNSDISLSLDAFIRSIEINKNIPHSIFLGAGASVSSGVISAEMCIWQWKRELFLSHNSSLDRELFDISVSSVKKRIQNWLDKQGEYPPVGSPDEYGHYAEISFPIKEDRRKYFHNISSGKMPYIGYQYLSLLGKFGLVSSVWTTNFDSLAARAMTSIGLDVIEIGLDTKDRIYRQPNPNEVLCISLHGDYRYDSLKNTTTEVQEQDKQLINALIEGVKNTSLIVVGYSGRDYSIMDALLKGFSEPGAGRLYWCGYDNSEPTAEVRELLEKIRNCGRDAFYISTQGFDDLTERLAFHCIDGSLLETAKNIREGSKANVSHISPFSINVSKDIGLIKSNAFEIELPREVFQFQIKDFHGTGFWSWLRNLTKGTQVVAAPLKGNILAFGSATEIQDLFAKYINGDITRVPVSDKELTYENSVIKSLMLSALIKAFADTYTLNTNGRNLLWKKKSNARRNIRGVAVNIHSGAVLSIKKMGNKHHLLLKPTVVGRSADDSQIEKEINRELRRVVLTKQYNSEFNDILDNWRKLLFPNKRTSLFFPANQKDSFRFNIRSAPAFARIGSNVLGKAIKLPSSAQKVITQQGTRIEEPRLLFSNLRADGYVEDTHQLRGILLNQPYDYSLTKTGLLSSVKIGVICPSRDSHEFHRYLSAIHQQFSVDSKQEYLLDYPGFSQSFGLPLDLPEPNQNGWHYSNEIDEELNTKTGANLLKDEIISHIESLESSITPNVIIIFIPDRWKRWESYEIEGEKFDLHDFIKAFCVQRGIPTQFIRESTLHKPYKCEILWWLSQSLYTKAMRTPWVLRDIDDETAFVGLGYGLDFSQGKGKHVVLGCSHIYGSDGQGLKYKLRKIENPIIRRDNPFMSIEDSRRVGDSVRQLFFESFHKLPKRVVIHKRNYFTHDEKIGLLEGLGGISNIDMLEIQFDPMLRYVASRVHKGNFSGDGFPVRRGTALVIDKRRAAIWVHGTADAVSGNRKYYQGKSRIPAPLVITRHYGTSSLPTLATEILGLSKMNWNTFDLYSKLPATIESSKAIARIGLLLDRFSNRSYDYRLFF